MMGEVLAATVKQMMPTVITMLSVLGCAKVMGYAGMISSISAFCIAVAGGLYPILAPWIGAVGAFVTGSGTSSGMLFGPIQSQAASALGVSDYWMVALTPWVSPPVRWSRRRRSRLASLPCTCAVRTPSSWAQCCPTPPACWSS